MRDREASRRSRAQRLGRPDESSAAADGGDADADGGNTGGDDDEPTVQFSKITIREYPPIVGDNPASHKGPPLSIDWEHQSEITVTVDHYEQHRPERRDSYNMVLSPMRRWTYFKELGFSNLELVQATKPVNIVRAQRRRTVGLMQLSHMHEKQEKVARCIKRILSRGRRDKREERKLLARFVKVDPSKPLLEDDSTAQRSQESSQSKDSVGQETALMGSDQSLSVLEVTSLVEVLEEKDSMRHEDLTDSASTDPLALAGDRDASFVAELPPKVPGVERIEL